jgi:hypothetical protein
MPEDELAKLDQVHNAMDNIYVKPFEYNDVPLVDVIRDINSLILEQGFGPDVIEVAPLKEACNSQRISFFAEDKASLAYTLNRIEFHTGINFSFHPPLILLCGKLN